MPSKQPQPAKKQTTDDVLRRMLATPPKQHAKPAPAKKDRKAPT